MNNHCPIPIMRFRPDADGLERWLGPLEAAIMAYIWNADRPVTVRRVWRALDCADGAQRALSTILTTMARLAEKRLLTRAIAGQTYIYAATCTEAEFVELQIAAILRSVEAS